MLPDDYLDLIAPMRAGADLRGRVVSVTPETRDAATVRIKPGRGWAGHVPGQYIRIGVDVDGVRNWRAYSLTSPVDAPDGIISICVKAIPDGKVSNHVVRALQPGTADPPRPGDRRLHPPVAGAPPARCSSPPAPA